MSQGYQDTAEAAKPKRRRKGGKPRRAGPFSRDQSLGAAIDDGRTKPARFYRNAIAELMDHLGPQPTAPQRMLVQSVAVKFTRLALLTEKVLSADTISEGSDHHCLAWMNSLRLDLMALGLEAKAVKGPTLSDLIDVGGST